MYAGLVIGQDPCEQLGASDAAGFVDELLEVRGQRIIGADIHYRGERHAAHVAFSDKLAGIVELVAVDPAVSRADAFNHALTQCVVHVARLHKRGHSAERLDTSDCTDPAARMRFPLRLAALETSLREMTTVGRIKTLRTFTPG